MPYLSAFPRGRAPGRLPWLPLNRRRQDSWSCRPPSEHRVPPSGPLLRCLPFPSPVSPLLPFCSVFSLFFLSCALFLLFPFCRENATFEFARHVLTSRMSPRAAGLREISRSSYVSTSRRAPRARVSYRVISHVFVVTRSPCSALTVFALESSQMAVRSRATEETWGW